MAMKYWRLKLKGERSMDEIQSAVGRSSGIIIRIHFESGETHVYFAAEKSAAPEAAKAMKEAMMPEEVSADKLTKFS
ncbi:MAG: hypothetical protein ACK4Z9_06560 [Thermodesulfovibrionales bacterium]